MTRWLQTPRGWLRLATWVPVVLVLVLTVGGSIGAGEGMRMERAGAAENTPPPKATPLTPPPTIPLKPTSWTVPRPPSPTALAPYPQPETPKPAATATASPSRTPMPTVVVPTVTGALPEGLKVVYAEGAGLADIVWAARAVEPSTRCAVAIIDDPNGLGTNASLSHDGTRIAYTAFPPGYRGHNHQVAELWLTALGGSERRLLASQVDFGRWVNYPIWSPDDRRIAFRRQSGGSESFTQTISVVDVATRGESVLASADHTTWLFPLDWSPDGRYLYYLRGTMRCELWRVDTARGNAAERLRAISGDFPACYHLSPDGAAVLCRVCTSRSEGRYATTIVPTGDGEEQTVVDGWADEFYNPIWHPDGTQVTLGLPARDGQQAELRTVDVQSHDATATALAPYGAFLPRAWSADGQWVAADFPAMHGGLALVSHDGARVTSITSRAWIDFIGWLGDNGPGDAG